MLATLVYATVAALLLAILATCFSAAVSRHRRPYWLSCIDLFAILATIAGIVGVFLVWAALPGN